MDTTLRKSSYPWVIVLSAIFWYGIGFGLLGNTVGLFYTPVATDGGWSMTEATFFMTLYPIAAAITSPFAGRVFNKFNKTNVVIAVVIGLWCALFVWSSTFTTLIEWNIYGVVAGILGGFLMYIPVPMLINNWFTKSKGIALGIAAASCNLIPALINPVITAQIASLGWRPVRMYMGIGFAVVLIPLVLIIVRKNPKDKGLLAWGEGEVSEVSETARLHRA